VVIVGADGVSYGAPPPPRSTFRELMLEELGSKLDLGRVHFVGQLDYSDYLLLLQISAAHVYLTYPFVLSWSALEAMSAGCLLIASATAPVLEVLKDGANGLTVDFFDHEQLAQRLESVLRQPERFNALRKAARATAVSRFDLKRVLLPQWMLLFDDLIARRTPRLEPVDRAPAPRAAARRVRAHARRTRVPTRRARAV
jgi:glycosyltransferase involved in cell wall biosynthesis